MSNVFDSFQTEVEAFFDGLNWTYILMYVFILYGIKNKPEFSWYNNLLKDTKFEPFKIWIAGLIVMFTFFIFRSIGVNGLDSEYVSQMLRSYIIVIVFNSVFSKKIESIDK